MNRRSLTSLAGAGVAVEAGAHLLSRRARWRKGVKAGTTADDTADETTDGDTSRGGEDRRKRPDVRGVIRLVTLALAVASVAKELRLPADQRTWHGVVAGFVPYDFRWPTMTRVRAAMWNPEGRIVGARAFGVGWTVNVGRAVALVRQRFSTAK